MAGQGIRRVARTRIATAALGAGITATVLGGAMLAAGPAGAAASPAAHAATAAAARSAAGTPVTSAVARLNSPARQRFVPWGRATAAGASAMMTPQARMAAAANSLGFSGAVLTAVSCTGRSQCTATGMASTRSGKNVKTLAERWNGTTWAVQSTPTPTSRTVLGGTLEGGVSCTSVHRLRGRRLLLQQELHAPAGRRLERPHLEHPAGRGPGGRRPAGRHLVPVGQGLHGGRCGGCPA